MLKKVLALVYVSVAWGSAFILIKYAEQTMPPMVVQAGRCTIGFIALVLVSLLMKRDLAGHARHWFAFLVFAILGIVILWVTVGFGQEYISAGLATVLVTVTPLVTYVITVFVVRSERFTATGLAGLIIGVLGLMLVIGMKNIMGEGAKLTGVILITFWFAVFAVNGIIAPRLAHGADPIASSAYYSGMAAAILWIITFIVEDPLTVKLTEADIAAETAMGVFSFASGFVVYYWLLNNAGAFFSSMVFYLMPVVGIAGGFLVFGEKVTVTQALGILVVFAGVYLVNRTIVRDRVKGAG